MVVDYVALGGILLMILIIFYLLFDPITTIHHHFHFLTGFEVCVSCLRVFPFSCILVSNLYTGLIKFLHYYSNTCMLLWSYKWHAALPMRGGG